MMHPTSLLVVDPDTRGLETLTFGFEREGCMVTGTADPRRAELLARTANPGLAIVAVRDPDKPSLEAIAGLREIAADLPVLAIGPSSLRASAMAAGATDFLATPIFLRDAISVGRLSVHTSEAARKTAAEKKPQGTATATSRCACPSTTASSTCCGRWPRPSEPASCRLRAATAAPSCAFTPAS